MQRDLVDRCHFPSACSCCPVSFLGSSPSPAKAHAPDTFFNYDIGLLCQEQAVLDMPWAMGTIEDMEKGLNSEKKLANRNEKDSDDDKDDDSVERMWDFRVWQLLNCWKGNASTRSPRGIMCNPLLTSRLALMGLLAVLLIVMTVLTWVLTSTNVKHSVGALASKFRQELLLHSEDNVHAVLHGNDASAASLATFISSLAQDSLSSITNLHDQVRPILFLVFSVLAKKVRVTFFGSSGLLLSYATDLTGTYLTYANTSYLSPDYSKSSIAWKTGEDMADTRPWYQWYRQKVNDLTGYPTGEALQVPPIAYWDNEAVKSSLQGKNGVASWGPSLIDSGEISFSFLSPVFQSQSAIPVAAVAVGVTTPDISNLLSKFDFEGGAIFLATTDGHLVAETGAGFSTSKMDNTSQTETLASQSDNPLVAGAAEYLVPYLSYISTMKGQSFTVMKLEIQGAHYIIDSAPLHLSGATLVCTVILPHASVWGLTEKWSHITLAVLVALATSMGVVGCFFVMLLTKGVSNEMRLRAALIQQLEETKRAETKSSHKSLVFANMSHDLRTPLAAILGLIDLCLCDASEFSELGSNLIQMRSCATNLLGILNSILDMSKIEAGKLLLQESEFDLVSALEEVIDTFSIVGSKKGVEIALDLSDGFVEKASWVIGDAGRVKQIMANLLSNGVKFTSEGHVVLRGRVKPLSISGTRQQFSRGRILSWPWNQLLRSPSREKEIRKLIQGFSQQDQDDNYIHVEFEVDDTGRGIPKERWKSVFENFVQVESSGPRNYDGTGLGLGIVRSLVRLMGGDINIIDKDEPGEPGTRFRFNLIFKCRKQPAKQMPADDCTADTQLQNVASLQATFGVGGDSVSPGWQLDTSGAFVFSSTLEETGFMSPPIMEGVHVLLAMQGQAGKRVVKKWLERRGLQVWTIANWDELVPAIGKIKHEVFSTSFSLSERLGQGSPENHIYDSWVDELDAKDFARNESSLDNYLQGLPTSDGTGSAQKHNLYNAVQAYLLLIVDATFAITSLDSLCSDLEEMLVEGDQSLPFRIAWLVNANTPSSDVQFLRRQTRVCNLILHKPLYASRLKCVWDLLQELVGNGVRNSFEEEAPHLSTRSREKVDLSAANSLYTSLSCMSTFHQDTGSLQSSFDARRNLKAHSATRNVSNMVNRLPNLVTLDSQGQQTDSPNNTKSRGKDQPLSLAPDCLTQKGSENLSASKGRYQNALSNMHILVAEDNAILQRLTKTQLIRLGATVECVDNGAEAARLVLENLYRSKVSSPEGNDAKVPRESIYAEKNQPFNLVLMDCEMPILNGYEATQRIRSEESRYGIRTPVIALTAHAMAQDEKKCIAAGMDFYLTKPLSVDALLNVVTKLLGKSTEVT